MASYAKIGNKQSEDVTLYSVGTLIVTIGIHIAACKTYELVSFIDLYAMILGCNNLSILEYYWKVDKVNWKVDKVSGRLIRLVLDESNGNIVLNCFIIIRGLRSYVNFYG